MAEVHGQSGSGRRAQDLRAKVATDSPDLETARKRLGHTTASTTKAMYDRKDEWAD
jgi:hypothetical protein